MDRSYYWESFPPLPEKTETPPTTTEKSGKKKKKRRRIKDKEGPSNSSNKLPEVEQDPNGEKDKEVSANESNKEIEEPMQETDSSFLTALSGRLKSRKECSCTCFLDEVIKEEPGAIKIYHALGKDPREVIDEAKYEKRCMEKEKTKRLAIFVEMCRKRLESPTNSREEDSSQTYPNETTESEFELSSLESEEAVEKEKDDKNVHTIANHKLSFKKWNPRAVPFIPRQMPCPVPISMAYPAPPPFFVSYGFQYQLTMEAQVAMPSYPCQSLCYPPPPPPPLRPPPRPPYQYSPSGMPSYNLPPILYQFK